MLWLECESYNEHITSIPDGDYVDIEKVIFKKFFRSDSNFSLTHLLPDNLRHLIYGTLSALGLVDQGTSLSSPYAGSLPNGFTVSTKAISSQLLLDAQRWVEEDMTSGSFRAFQRSSNCARMIGYLRYSPPFVKMSLMDVLRCDRKSMYFVVFLCQIKRYVESHSEYWCRTLLTARYDMIWYAHRHAAVHCITILRNRMDEHVEGSLGYAEVGTYCFLSVWSSFESYVYCPLCRRSCVEL